MQRVKGRIFSVMIILFEPFKNIEGIPDRSEFLKNLLVRVQLPSNIAVRLVSC